ETAPPPGYDLPADVFSDLITIDATNAGGTLPVTTFDDPRTLSSLAVQKLDASSGASLAGAEFTLWSDVAPAGVGPEDTVVDTCTSGGNGRCSVGGLDFGSYYWE